MFDWITALLTFLLLVYLGAMVFSLYVHRHLGHRHWDLHPTLIHFCRFYLWFVAGYGFWSNWQQLYAAKHRKHHKLSDLPEDPHSPIHFSAKDLFLKHANLTPGGPYYISHDEIQKFAPDIVSSTDWLQKNVYRRKNLGKILFWIVLTLLFSWTGFILGGLNFFFIAWYGIAVGNYIVHKWGTIPKFRPKESADQSKNSYPWCFFMAGEELHANHHDQPYNPNNGRHWYEIDVTYHVGKFLSYFGVVKFRQR